MDSPSKFFERVEAILNCAGVIEGDWLGVRIGFGELGAERITNRGLAKKRKGLTRIMILGDVVTLDDEALTRSRILPAQRRYSDRLLYTQMARAVPCWRADQDAISVN